jgi:hypothetical protein
MVVCANAAIPGVCNPPNRLKIPIAASRVAEKRHAAIVFQQPVKCLWQWLVPKPAKVE